MSNLKEDLDILDAKLNKLKVDYDQYFMKILKKEPFLLREEIDRIVLRYSNQPIQNTLLQFRYGTLTAKYTSLKHHWDRILRMIEEGTYERNAPVNNKPAAQKKQVIQPVQQEAPTAAIPNNDKLAALYQYYIEKRKQTNESVNGLTFDKFEKALSSQTEKIKTDYKCNDVEYKVSVKDGKTKIIIAPKK
ncbi:MAG: hypothetical protein HZB79_03210 [Deltaproteobacteria bacterium]|nr:hypothetical protein [Deltaproteobacteria bacterium]